MDHPTSQDNKKNPYLFSDTFPGRVERERRNQFIRGEILQSERVRGKKAGELIQSNWLIFKCGEVFDLTTEW